MKIAVIGAGPSGLVSIKEFLEHGFEVVCFEKADDIGGLFRFDPTGVSVYESTLMTSSAYISCFSDFPPPKNAAVFLKQKEYFDYLTRYTEHFQLRACIRFNQEVKSVVRTPDEKWVIKTYHRPDQKIEEDTFDAVAVCSGVHQIPMMPLIPGMELFKGEVQHSALYKNPSNYKGKNTVIIGGGESASDITNEISRVAKSCYISLRRGAYILPRFFLNYPNDHYTDRIVYSPPLWLFRVSYPIQEIFWLRLVLCLLMLPFLIMIAYVIAVGLIHLFNIYSWGLSQYPVFVLLVSFAFFIYIVLKIIKTPKSTLSPATMQIIAELRNKSGASQAEQFATKSEGLAIAISSGRCTLKAEIQEITENGVKFKDGSFVEADNILCCTGFKMEVPFLQQTEPDLRRYYKNCFNPHLGNSLCFIGFVRPGIGAIPPMSEMQARWFAAILSKQCPLPSKEDMLRQIEIDSNYHRKKFRLVSDRLPALSDFTSYMDQLASWIGCKPKFKWLISDPLLLWKVYTSPFSGYQYRLFGPFAKKDIAAGVIKRSPVMPLKAFGHISFGLAFLISSLLFKMNLKKFKPHLDFK